jgi:DUF971 family protein
MIPFAEGEMELGPALTLRWRGGRVQRLSAAYLRAHCGCATCRNAAIQIEPSMFPGLQVQEALAVGAYALQLKFSDGHSHGAYPFSLLESMPDEA